MENRTIDHDKRLWIGLPFQTHALAQQMGLAQVIEKAGGVFASACMAAIPDAPLPQGVREIGTNSFKAAHYITRLTKGAVSARVGNMETCIRAITGGKWEESQ